MKVRELINKLQTQDMELNIVALEEGGHPLELVDVVEDNMWVPPLVYIYITPREVT